MTNVEKAQKFSPFFDLIEGTIESIGETKTVFVAGEQKQVTEAVLKDETGSIKLSLWGDQIKLVAPGSKVKITNSYVKQYQGQNILNISRNGKLDVIEF